MVNELQVMDDTRRAMEGKKIRNVYFTDDRADMVIELGTGTRIELDGDGNGITVRALR